MGWPGYVRIKVQVCRRIGETGGSVRFQRYTTNYGGPAKKGESFPRTGAVSGGSSMGVFLTVLSDVCYRLHGDHLCSAQPPASMRGITCKICSTADCAKVDVS